jgi:mannonate dehydratase
VKLGHQLQARSDDDLALWAQLGVTHLCQDPPGDPHGWTRDDLLRLKERIERHGMVHAMVQLPLSSRPIEESSSPDILLAGPDRDRQIDSICNLIRLLAEVGIPAAKYNLNLIGIPRTAPERGRGGSTNEAFRWARADRDAPPGAAGLLDPDTNWERIDHFLARVVPVAEAYRIRLACHPHDPWTPPGYRGVTRVLGTVEGLKRFVQMHESPYHGLNFCQGTVAEMLDDPRREIEDVIRWFASRDKIFNLHFRNIRGRRLDFMETFPDEGDMDMPATLRIYAEHGYAHMVMPDHVPHVTAADERQVAFAFALGYIRGVMQAIGA